VSATVFNQGESAGRIEHCQLSIANCFAGGLFLSPANCFAGGLFLSPAKQLVMLNWQWSMTGLDPHASGTAPN
jgi:hypothetical protein